MCPFIVFRNWSIYFPWPIVSKTKTFYLTSKNSNIFWSLYLRMYSGFYCIVFSWKSESIPSHWMKHVESFHSLISRIYICCSIIFHMSHMKSCSAWIWKHVENIKFFLIWIIFSFCIIWFIPFFLPFLLYFSKIIFLHILKYYL